MKRFRLISVLLVLLILISSSAFGTGMSINLDGSKLSFSTEVVNARTYVKVDELEKVGLNSTTSGNIVRLENNDVKFEFTIDSNKVKVNGLELTIDAKPFTRNTDVYVPLRFVLETMNYKISWDNSTQSINAEKQADITYPIEIETNDRKYVVKEEPKTIVSMAPGVTEKLFALGVGDRIKGRTQYCNYPEEVENIQNIGSLYEPNLELIVSINPDIVIGETHFKQEVIDKLESAGITVVAKPSAKNMEEVYEYMIQLGAIVNKNYEARALVSSLRGKVDRVKYVLSDIPENKKPSVYYVVGTGQYGEYTAGRDTFISDLITVAGGKNAAADVEGWSYSLEKLINNDPDIILGSIYNLDTMVNGESYQILSAIKNKKYYEVDQDVFERASPRSINVGLKKLVEIFYNEKVKELGF